MNATNYAHVVIESNGGHLHLIGYSDNQPSIVLNEMHQLNRVQFRRTIDNWLNGDHDGIIEDAWGELQEHIDAEHWPADGSPDRLAMSLDAKRAESELLRDNINFRVIDDAGDVVSSTDMGAAGRYAYYGE